MQTLEFVHSAYGELVKQFGLGASVTLDAWDKLPEVDREKWIAALAVVHARVYPHGPPVDRYAGERATGAGAEEKPSDAGGEG